MPFSTLNLDPALIKVLKELQYATPTPIQQKAIPLILSGVDLRASAQTGTGKTAAFILPALNRLATPSSRPGNGPRVLILVPTRELACQVAEAAMKYARHMPRIKIALIYGGVPYPVQNRALSRPLDILIATCGRLQDHMKRGRVNFSRLEMFILDEADRMLDMGFIDAVDEIAALLPKERQTLMFSATLQGTVMNLSKRLLKQPAEINISPAKAKHENIEQRLHFTDDINHKYCILDHLLKDPALQQVLIFTATKRHADHLSEKLFTKGHPVAALHGDMNQRQRTRSIDNFRRGTVRILVATDVAARGIDILTITHVINFDLPMTAEDYVHRIGRTGRAGGNGIALSFVSSKDRPMLSQIEAFTGHKITTHQIQGLEPKKKAESHNPNSNKKKNFGQKFKPNRFQKPFSSNKSKGKFPFPQRFKKPKRP